MSTNPHEEAIAGVLDSVLEGTITEIIPNAACQFDFSDRHILWDEFLSQPQSYSENIVLHILLGHGVSVSQVLAIIEKAKSVCRRLIVLEHNPYAFTDHEFVCHDVFSKVYSLFEYHRHLGRRNILLIDTQLDKWDWTKNKISKKTIDHDKPYGGWPHADRAEILLMTSEHQADGRLLTDKDIIQIEKNGNPISCVCGGMMFLNLMAEVANRPIHVIDTSVKQLLYAKAIIDAIEKCESLEAFDEEMQVPSIPSLYSQAHRYMRMGALIHGQPENPRMFQGRWIDTVKQGSWRSAYKFVRQNLNVVFHYGKIDTDIPKNHIVYTSTVDPNNFNGITNPKIEAFTKRDIPQWNTAL